MANSKSSSPRSSKIIAIMFVIVSQMFAAATPSFAANCMAGITNNVSGLGATASPSFYMRASGPIAHFGNCTVTGDFLPTTGICGAAPYPEPPTTGTAFPVSTKMRFIAASFSASVVPGPSSFCRARCTACSGTWTLRAGFNGLPVELLSIEVE